MFITFEGIEGCGKSTQAGLLHERLTSMGHEVFFTREPGGTKISEQIRTIILNPENSEMTFQTELLLYLAARAQHTSESILPALKFGKIVICDRYIDSTYAYQGAARDIDIDTVKSFNNFATSSLIPDITFILDIPVKLSILRISKKKLDRLEQESETFHRKVRDGFLNLSKENNRYVVINGDDDIQNLHQKIFDVVKTYDLKLRS